jgi:tetratricopeptide (TPR) repeat protein
MGQCQNVTGDFHGALGSYRKSAKMRETIVFNSPELQGNVQTRLAGTYGYMAGTFLSLGDLDQAIAMQTKSMAILKSLSAADPGNARYSHYICESYYWTGYYQQKKNDLPAALGNFQQALSGFQRISAADPAEVRAKGYVGYCYTHIGSVQSALGHSAEAMVSLQKGLEVAEEMHRSDNSGTYITLPDIVDAYDAIGVAYAREAEQPHLSRAERIDRWKQARSAYQSGLNNLLEAKRLGASDATLHGKDQRLAGEIAKCDAKLAELTALADHWKQVWAQCR